MGERRKQTCPQSSQTSLAGRPLFFSSWRQTIFLFFVVCPAYVSLVQKARGADWDLLHKAFHFLEWVGGPR